MSESKKHPGGRPLGARYPKQISVYTTEKGMDLLKAIANHRDTTQAEVIRQLIREEAQRLGLADGGD